MNSRGPVDVEPKLQLFAESTFSYLASITVGNEGRAAWNPVCHGTFPFDRRIAKSALNKGQILLYLSRDGKGSLGMPEEECQRLVEVGAVRGFWVNHSWLLLLRCPRECSSPGSSSILRLERRG
jgi:hypothetical protein